MRNLQHFNPEVTHERFVDAVVAAFRDEYGVDEEVMKLARRFSCSPDSLAMYRCKPSKRMML